MRSLCRGTAAIFLRTALLASGTLACVLPALRAEEPFSLDTTPGKLPKDVIPHAYAVRIMPNPETRACEGSETIEIEVVRPVHQIVLNALSMEVTGASLSGAAPVKSPLPLQPVLDSAEQTLTVALSDELPPGKYRLELAFKYQLHDLSQGLYLEHYDAPSGKKAMLASQMEPTDARRMFPCWDEPAFRAAFQLSVSLPLPLCKKFTAISNMPTTAVNVTQENGDSRREFVFAPTPPMASYLVALVAGELEELQGEADGVQIRIITTEGKRESARYALDSAEKIFKYYNEYFGVHYPLPKLDEIAVPGGFGGAMENWGAIIYAEPLLLYDPRKSAPSVREDVFAVMAHEMAHQWFGDLVTMAWWDNLWLNEGFASWMGTKTTDHFNPEWQSWLRANAGKERAMNDDALKTTHPIQQLVKTESQAMSAFDSITYLKGQSFIRMLESYLGPDVFRDGIRRYMAAHRFGSTTTADLWKSLGESSGQPVAAFAQGWTLRLGFPLVKLGTDAAGQPVLSQERFTVRSPNAEALTWTVPVILEDAAAPGQTTRVVIDSAGPIPLPPAGAKTVDLKLNAGDVGYYRSEYSPEHFNQLLSLSATLSEADRLNLLGDTWALMMAGRQPAALYLDLLEALRGDTGTAFLEHAIDHLKTLRLLLLGTPASDEFLAYMRGYLEPQFQRLGWEARPGEPSTDGIIRGSLIQALALAGDPAVTAEAERRFTAAETDPGSLPGDVRRSILFAVGVHADAARFERLHQLAIQAPTTEAKSQYYSALGAAGDPGLQARALAITLTDEAPMSTLMRTLLPAAFQSEHPDLAWANLQIHVRETLARTAMFSGSRLFSVIASAFSTDARADEIAALVAGIPQLASSADIRRDVEGIRTRAELKDRELGNIRTWLAPTPRQSDSCRPRLHFDHTAVTAGSAHRLSLTFRSHARTVRRNSVLQSSSNRSVSVRLSGRNPRRNRA